MKITNEMQLISAESEIDEYKIEYSINATQEGEKTSINARVYKGENNVIGSISWDKNSFSISMYKDTALDDAQKIINLILTEMQELVK